MSKIICIAYQPGAFGSFIGWTIERFTAARKQYQPPVLDDPLASDGSSHGYASFCKIKKNSEFVEGFYEARRSESPYGYQIYAGWPQGINEDLLWSINRVANNMSTFDKMFVIECGNEDDHFLRYLRNESTLDRDRWYGMIEVENGEDLLKRLRSDIENGGLPEDYQHGRLSRIGFSEILSGDPTELFDRIFKHLDSASCDRELFLSTIDRMRSMQDVYTERLNAIRAGEFSTPAEEAIHRYITGDK